MTLIVAPLLAQDAAHDRFRAIIKDVPLLAVERIELNVTPPLEGISAVTADKQGNLYVLHRPPAGDPVVVLDAKGKRLRSWGAGMFQIPHAIRLDPDGNVWTVDAHSSKVYKFTPAGKKLLEISVGGIPDPDLEFGGATDIAFTRNGKIFVTDGYANARIIEYDAAGHRLNSWGKHGTGPGEFNLVHCIAVGPDDNLYVADRENGRLQWFDQKGKFLGQFEFGGQFYNVACGPNGELYGSIHPKGVSLDTEFNVVKIDRSTGRIAGRFEVRSHELDVAPDGAILPATRSSLLVVYRPSK